jgi:Ca2+-binding RTX toxin-like protein
VYRDTLRGGGGRDSLEGGDGPDELWGGPGNDRVEGGQGGDHVRGGSGRDEFVNSDTAAERLDFGAGDALRRIFAAGPHVFVRGGVLHFIGSEGRDQIFVKQSLSPPIPDPTRGPQVVTGFNYTLILDSGSRYRSGSLDSGGITAVRVEVGGGNDVVNLANWSDLPNPEIGVTAVTVPATVLGGDGNDLICGGAAGDAVFGGDGDDTVTGGGGTDEVRGEGGRDTFFPAWDSPAELLDREADESPENPSGTPAA